MKTLSILTLCTALCGPAAEAAVIVNLTETPDAWTAAYAGTLDVSDLTPFGLAQSATSLFYRDQLFVQLGVGEPVIGQSRVNVERYEFASRPAEMPTEPGRFNRLPHSNSTVTGAGPMFWMEVYPSMSLIGVDPAFESGFIEGFTRWPGLSDGPMGLTLADSMLREGRYVYGLANGETVTLNIGNAFAQPLPTGPDTPQVPLPAGLPLLAAGLAALAGLARRRR